MAGTYFWTLKQKVSQTIVSLERALNSHADFWQEFVQLTEVKFNISFSCKKKKSSFLKKDENILKAVEKIVLFFIKNI